MNRKLPAERGIVRTLPIRALLPLPARSTLLASGPRFLLQVTKRLTDRKAADAVRRRMDGLCVRALLRRERAGAPMPHEVIDVVGPEVLTG